MNELAYNQMIFTHIVGTVIQMHIIYSLRMWKKVASIVRTTGVCKVIS